MQFMKSSPSFIRKTKVIAKIIIKRKFIRFRIAPIKAISEREHLDIHTYKNELREKAKDVAGKTASVY